MVKKASLENILYEPQNIIKKQEVRPQNLTSVQSGWRRLAILELVIIGCKVTFFAIYSLNLLRFQNKIPR